VVGPTAPKEQRNIVGVIGKVGVEAGKKVIGLRKKMRDLMRLTCGKAIHPVFGLPGGVSKGITKDEQKQYIESANEAVEFGKFSLDLFNKIVLQSKEYVDAITSDAYTHKTYYMGLVDENNKVNFYDGKLRVVDPSGKEFVKFGTAITFSTSPNTSSRGVTSSSAI
jgi:F420-non-reducing hydrogenase large subunit